MNESNFFLFSFNEFKNSIKEYCFWKNLSELKVKQRYKRTILGPLWTTLITSLQILTTSIVVTFVFKGNNEKYIPYIALGIMFWNFFSSAITECSIAFISNKNYITQIKKSFLVYIFSVLYYQILVFLHNVIVVIIIFMIYNIEFKISNYLIFIINFLLVTISILSIGFMLAILSTRFRDFSQMISSVFIILFWLTPVIYYPELLGEIKFLVDMNPLTNFLSLLRSPLLDEEISMFTYIYVIVFNLIFLPLSMILYKRVKSSIIFWL